jgi:signal transduction histidine kinase
MTRRWPAIALACVVAGTFEVVHSLAFAHAVAAGAVAFSMVTMGIELIALTVLYDRRRWSLWWSAALALGIGEASAFAAALVHPLPVAITLQVGLFDGLLGLGLWALAVVVPQVMNDARTRALEAERERLRAHLQPHFLLNTLNTISGLAVDEPHRARELIAALADLLRDSLATVESHTIAEEIAWLRRYAEIIETRHPQVRFRWDIAEATRHVRVPRLLLQPLVENAIQHGALRRREGGEVSVRTEYTTDHVTCVIEDNGPGLSEPRDGALGISLVERRLALELAGKGAFRLERVADMTRSIVEIPS